MEQFIDKIQKQLKNMSEKDKDDWIISQAKIVSEGKQENFYKSLCGTKKVIDMPDRQEIDRFCKNIQSGEIVIEYETHYVEFDDMGYYIDDWGQTYHDPSKAMRFIESVLHGCHDLVILEEYAQAFEILDEIIRLEFEIVDHPDTEDSCEDDFFNLYQAAKEGVLYIDCEEVLRDYVEACRKSVRDEKTAARKIVTAFEMELFEKCNLNVCIAITDKDFMLNEIKNILHIDLENVRKEYEMKLKTDKYYVGQFWDQMRIHHINELMDYFEKIGKEEEKPKESLLRGAWTQIKELISELMDEPYIDDQVEIDEIWEIAEALIKRGGFEKEPWEVKEMILKEIYDNNFFDYYGVYDPMCDLANAICVTREENLKRAEIMMSAGRGYLGCDAAELYRELGEEVKCVQYFEEHLGKEKEAYEIVIDYYKDTDHEKAVEIARLALDKCKEDQTPFFVFLLQDAKDKGNEADFKKLIQSAHRRRAVKSSEIDAIFS